MMMRQLTDVLASAGEMLNRLCFAAILGSPAVTMINADETSAGELPSTSEAPLESH